jgi:hypothetical protein
LVVFRYVLDVTGTVILLAPVVKKSNTSVVEAVAKTGRNRSREYFCKHSPAAGKVWQSPVEM